MVRAVADTSRQAMASQYGDDRNLAARQSIYRYRRSGDGRSFYDVVVDLAALDGDERVLDVGCGNGQYLRTLGLRAHRGAAIGFDLSAGMAKAATAWGPAATGNAQALPVRTACADVVLCPHMLYHVPNQAAAVSELRRALRPGGRAIVVTNSTQHFRQVDDLVASLTGARPLRLMVAFTMEGGEPVLRTAFDSIERHEFTGALDVTDAQAVVDYVGSVREVYGLDDAGLEAVRHEVQAVIDRDGAFEITNTSGAFVCRSPV